MNDIAVLNPKDIDGEPHEVAEQVGRNVEQLLAAAQEATENMNWAARGAWMTAEHHRSGDMPSGADFPNTAQGRRLSELHDTIKMAQVSARTMTVAASWNPRSHL